MNLLIYTCVAVVAFGGGVAVGYLMREARYWGEIAASCRAMRHGSPVRQH